MRGSMERTKSAKIDLQYLKVLKETENLKEPHVGVAKAMLQKSL
jgi:hypothetical protein